jgi:hypothetical protein
VSGMFVTSLRVLFLAIVVLSVAAIAFLIATA